MKYEYVLCPKCSKKLCRIEKDSMLKNVYIWCKNCKKEILINRAMSQK